MNLTLRHCIPTDSRAFAWSFVAFILMTSCGSQAPLESKADVVDLGDGTCLSPQVIETVEIPLLIRSQVFTPYCTVRDDQGGSSKTPPFPFRKVEFSTRTDEPNRDKRSNFVPVLR
jgi:hypothetical protein